MTTYSQYDLSSGFTSAKANGTDSRTWVSSNSIISNAIRYNWSGATVAYDMAFNTSTSATPHVWRDDANTFPVEFSNDGNSWSTAGCPDAETIYLKAANGDVSSFLSPQWQYSSANPANSSGGGTLGGTVYIQDAKIVKYGGVTGLRFEQRGYPAASYELIGTSSVPTWSLTSQTNDLQHHVSNLNPGTYYLYQDSVLVATLSAGASKVSCNFW